MSEFESQSADNAEGEQSIKFNPYLAIVTVQAAVITVIVATLLVVKFLFPSLFSDIKREYSERFLVETTVDEVLEDGESEDGGDGYEV